MRISDWSSDVCSSDLLVHLLQLQVVVGQDDDLALLALDRAFRALEVEPLIDLAADRIEGIVDLVHVGLGDDVEGRHWTWAPVGSRNSGVPIATFDRIEFRSESAPPAGPGEIGRAHV